MVRIGIAVPELRKFASKYAFSAPRTARITTIGRFFHEVSADERDGG
jgi:hypothetical protein